LFADDPDRNAFEKQLAETLANLLLEQPGLSPLDSKAEAKHAVSLLDARPAVALEPNLAFLEDYGDPRFEGLGGSGIVFSIFHAELQTRRAIKLPREAVYANRPQPGQLEPTDPEVPALTRLSHEAITRLFLACPLEHGKGWVLLTEYVQQPRDLASAAEHLCNTGDARRGGSAFDRAMATLATHIYTLASAIHYMHDQGLFHFDLKPENLLVSGATQRPYVTDLGFARDVRRYQPDQEVEVRFTAPYAHPSLTDLRTLHISQNFNKAKNLLFGKQLTAVFDLFAFGRTLQRVLKCVASEHGERAHTNYVFNYLHVIACLCLDGHNTQATETDGLFASDFAMDHPVTLYRKSHFSSFAEVQTALERLLGRARVEDEVPELDPWYPATINASDRSVTTITPRVKSILEHPAFWRLREAKQLGLLETIYPNANHTRYQHDLGVYHAARLYLTALYYDHENPTFRILFHPQAAAELLLASLVHDLGQTSFFHELEETSDTFSHTRATERVLRDTEWRDARGRTLAEVIQATDEGGWSTPLDNLLTLLQEGGDPVPLVAVLREILNSYVDADKYDYLLRDSVEARVPYGFSIDQDRFLRSLTTAVTPAGLIRLAIKEKGLASALGFVLARYQLYESLYWHHSFRAAKAMFHTAVAIVLEELGEPASLPSIGGQLADLYVDAVVLRRRLDPPKDRPAIDAAGRATSPGIRAQMKLLQQEIPALSQFSAEPSLLFFWRLSGADVALGRSPGGTRVISASDSCRRARRLIEDLMARRYYKRVFEVPLSAFDRNESERLKAIFADGARRLEFSRRVGAVLEDAVFRSIQTTSAVRRSLQADSTLDTFAQLGAESVAFVLDLPTRGWLSGGDPPAIVPDAKRRYFRSATSTQTSRAADSPAWAETVERLMNDSAKLRILAHPGVHNIMASLVTNEAVADALAAAVPELRHIRS
jgi:serine/threonine protein kinase